MKIGEAEAWLRQRLATLYGEGESFSMASIVMNYITGLSIGERMAIKQDALPERQLQQLNEVAGRLEQNEPVQYVLGECWFYGKRFFVDKTVLIPRSETEELVDWVLKEVKDRNPGVFEKGPTDADETGCLKLLDIGTGSGCIALSLKNKMPKAEVWGCDVSEEALNVARRNGSELDIRVDFQGVNFLDEAQQKLLPTVDVIVSNPPYIPQSGAAQMHANVL
ncbi:MAG: hypothetical protein JWP88_1714, partial [Flaviaesturariibacter sp.]|nr:hypothetical protein [Flaviaesturariibacter sp.]